MSAPRRQVRVVYAGEVQGVGFRYTARSLANGLGVTGGVENLNDGTVRLVAEGAEEVLKRLLLNIRLSRVGMYIADERVQWGDEQGLSGFYYR